MKQIILLLLIPLVLVCCTQDPIEPETDTTLEDQVFALVNDYRLEKDLPVFETCAKCADQAREHSIAMSKGKVEFGHDGSDLRFEALTKSVNATAFAENVAKGYPTPEQVVVGWLDSKGHRENIEGNYSHMGIGIAESTDGEKFYTQIFVRIP